MPKALTLAFLQALYCGGRAGRFINRRSKRSAEARRIREEFYDRVWHEAAREAGATIESLGSGIWEIRRDGLQTRVAQNWTALDDAVTLTVAGNKPLTYRLLAEENLPIPPYAEFSLNEIRTAEEFLASADGDCVVKPAADTGGGLGVTTGVRTRWGLYRAAAAAAVYGRDLLIQTQIEGKSYRLVYLDGVLLDAVVQSPPSVVGDGKSSLRQFVNRANAERLRKGADLGQGLITSDLEMKHTLAEQGLRLSSVPRAGRVVSLKTAINDNAGGDNHSAGHQLCESIVADGARASRAAGARLAGVDVVTTDPGRPLAETGGAIIEVNTTPGFYWHYHKCDGPFPVAKHVLERIFEDLGGAPRRTVGANRAAKCQRSIPLPSPLQRELLPAAVMKTPRPTAPEGSR